MVGVGLVVTTFRRLTEWLFNCLGFAIMRRSVFETLTEDTAAAFDLKLFAALPDQQIPYFVRHRDRFTAQLRQDMFALSETNMKTDGYFVEFGATDGLSISNTYILERDFGWQGIVAEPGRSWHQELRDNRNCIIDTRCIWSTSHEFIAFNETTHPELSTIHKFASHDHLAEQRQDGTIYDVETVSLLDLLSEYNAPYEIDYLSIDTEGSEYEILKAFDFDQYSFSVITCEHNNTPNREKIYDLLTSKGYRRKFEEFSSVDDWYVKDPRQI